MRGGGLHRLGGQVHPARAAIRAGAGRVLAVRVLPLGADVVQGHLLRPALLLQELPRRRAMLRVRVPRPPRRGHEVPRAAEAPSPHPGWQLLGAPHHAISRPQVRDFAVSSRRGQASLSNADFRTKDSMDRVKFYKAKKSLLVIRTDFTAVVSNGDSTTRPSLKETSGRGSSPHSDWQFSALHRAISRLEVRDLAACSRRGQASLRL